MRPRTRTQSLLLLALCSLAGIALTTRYLSAQSAQAADVATKALEPGFEQIVKPFFKQNCMQCHNSDLSVAGVRVDQLDAKIEDRHIQTWESILRRVKGGTMPPKGLPQPSAADRDKLVAWVTQAIEVARMRPAPKNGLVRRLTVAQYRNTLRELFQLDDDLTRALPPDAVSKDGFQNNKDTLQLSPLLTEAYFEIAEDALNRAIVDPKKKPVIQDFRMDLGAGVNPAPLPEKLVMGAGSQLLENADVLVTQLTPVKPFPFNPFVMRTKYRYIEGYRGNDTVRGWRDFDSIYHAVFADMRGSGGYPKGSPYGTVPQGLLLRPAIPNSEMFEDEGTYGPKANFKISVRELPDEGRFRVTVTAAKYNDGLLLDPGAKPREASSIVIHDLKKPTTLTILKSGVYQVDVYGPNTKPPAPDATHLTEGLSGVWPAEGPLAGKLEGKAKVIDSPAGKAVSLAGGTDALVIPRNVIPTDDEKNVGEGDFSVAAWIHPTQLQRAGIVTLAGHTLGWYFELPDARGTLRLRTIGQAEQANAMITTRPGSIRVNEWQHVAAVVRRGRNETQLYINGNLVARSAMGTAQFDDLKADLQIGSMGGADALQGDIADVRLYRRPLEEAEIQALIQPGKSLIKPVAETPRAPRRQQLPEVTLTLGDRQFSGELKQPAFLALRLEAGPLQLTAKYPGPRDLDYLSITPVEPDSQTAKNFLAFEKRLPRVGVHLGLRRDCGSTFGPVGAPQTVTSEKLLKYVFEGAIRNFPAPEVEKNNVNYLAGVREIGVRSEYTDGRDMPRLLIRSVEFEGPYYDQWPPASHKTVFVDFDRKNDLPAYANKIVHEFAGKAYRRPVTDAEAASLMGVYNKSMADGRSFEDSVKDALLVALTSPQFLFLVETSASPAPEPLSAYELASKLSYFLWNGPPDNKTLQLASTGTLPKVVDAEVERMVADPKFARFTNEFTSQWLNLDKFQVLESDKRKFPKLTRDTRAQLKQEPVEFVQYLIRHNLPVKNLISSDVMVANEVVAGYYDLGSKTENGFKFVAFPHGRPELGGILTDAAVMAGLSDGRESNPVKRGAWVARKIISEPPNDPPPNVPALKEETKDLTLRQRLEQHRNQPACAQCHSKIDPWGVPFEEYDAGGRRKLQSVDARSTLPDKTEVTGVNDLKKYLAEDRIDQVAFSVLKHLEIYASGRNLTYNELNYLKKDALKLKPGGYRMKDMVRYVVNSKVFLEK
jgi:mono/diheme cytochrome c family protein